MQIENEYKVVEAAFHSRGPPYVQWAAAMAVNLQTGVPWMMCKQDDAPDPIVSAILIPLCRIIDSPRIEISNNIYHMVRLIPAMASSVGKHFLDQIHLTSQLCGQKIGHLGVRQILFAFLLRTFHSPRGKSPNTHVSLHTAILYMDMTQDSDQQQILPLQLHFL